MDNSLQTRIEDMIALVDEAERQVRDGIIVNIGSLEQDVDLLCREVMAGEAQEARNVQPFMADLIARLDALAQSLEDFKEQYTQKGS